MICDNLWLRNIFLLSSNKKKSLGAKSGLCEGWAINSMFWPVKKALNWADVRELALALWTMIRLFLLVFRISPKKLWCTTQNWPCNVAQVVQSLHDLFCRLFASKCLSHKQLSLDLDFEGPHDGLLFCFGLIRIDLCFVTCVDLINVFWRPSIVFFQPCYAPIDQIVFERVKDSATTKVFYGQVFMQYRMYVGGRNAQG